MALWTDPSRQCLINCIRNRPVIWDKNYTGESNYRSIKNNSFREVTDEMNSLFQMSVKFTVEDVRSQWKNLKDTFVRKLRWVHEGKYVEDASKEPTWKFYRMLTFLDDKEEKQLADDVEHTYELAQTAQNNIQNCHLKQDRQQSSMMTATSSMMPMGYEPASSEEQMLQMFNAPPVLAQQQQQQQQQQAPSQLLEQRMATCSAEMGKTEYSPRSQNGSSSGVEEEEEDEQPERKKPYRRQPTSIQPMHVIQTPPMGQDEFDHFGALVASNLRRLCADQGRLTAIRVQRRVYDALFLEE
ncbi:unnamed protein product [Caenorhabditis sp. 36 PRJEB53466]|nr:unnamed protein product [Caenorhabditis sp. 36 PRJEB53466]